MLKQKEAVSYSLEANDILAALPTGFRKSMMFQSFILAKEMDERSAGCFSGRSSCW